MKNPDIFSTYTILNFYEGDHLADKASNYFNKVASSWAGTKLDVISSRICYPCKSMYTYIYVSLNKAASDWAGTKLDDHLLPLQFIMNEHFIWASFMKGLL